MPFFVGIPPFAHSITSEYAIMHDPNDPNSFTFHKMEMTDLEMYLDKGPIAELEDEIIAVNSKTGIVYKWDKEKSTFIDTTKMYRYF